MSEAMTKQRPTMDLDDFERRMRQHDEALGGYEDPLAELARLVGQQHDPYGDVFAQEAAAGQAPRLAHHEPPLDQTSGTPKLFGDFAAIEAGLRGGLHAHGEPSKAEPAAHDYYAAHDQAYAENQSWSQAPENLAGGQGVSRRPIYAVAATIAVAVIGIGVAFAYKGASSSPGEIKTIMAAAGPTKIQPPADASVDSSNQDAAVLNKTTQPAPTKLVNNEEQPVDLAQTVQDNAARAAVTSGADAASVPVPPPPAQAQTASVDAGAGAPVSVDPMGDQAFGMAGMPAPKRVKVVSVRPDGTILPNDQPPAAAMPAPRQSAAKTSDRAGPVARASTPRTTTAKTTSRVVASKPMDLAARPDDTDGQPAAKPAHKLKPQRVASADTGEQDATGSIAPAATSGGGGFAVQLAAPGSEADAKSASSRLAKKYADALSGHHLGFHKAQSNGKSVFRVRVGSLSKDEAVSLCEKLKAGGGSCFVAKN